MRRDQGAATDAAAREVDRPATSEGPAFDAATYWETRLRASFSFHGVGFRGLGELYNRLLYRQRLHVVRRALRRHRIGISGSDVIELGPGTGFYVREWLARGAASVTGLDITTTVVERLSASYPDCRFMTTDIGRPWPLEDASADLVTAFDVLFHVVDDDGFATAIDEMGRVLRPGGHALFTDFFPPHEPFGTGHQRSRTADDYRRALAHAGLEIRGRLPVFVFMHPPVGLPPGRRRDWLAARWERLSTKLHDTPSRGRRIGYPWYLADRALTLILPGGPSMELIVARKPVNPA